MVDRDTLSARLGVLEGYLNELGTFRATSRDEFVAKPELHHLAERYLQLACECILDIAHHVIADEGYRQATSYRDAMDVLRETGHLDARLAEKLKEWMGLRNILVHFYVAIDHERTHDAIVEDLDDLRAFAASIAPLLGDAAGD